MAHEISWYMGRHILYAQMNGDDLSRETMWELDDLLIPYIASSDAPIVHVIIDMSGIRKLSTEIKAIQAGFAFADEPQVGSTILISPDPAIKYLRALIARVTGLRLRSFDALEEAIFYLQDEDSSLHTLLCDDYGLVASF